MVEKEKEWEFSDEWLTKGLGLEAKCWRVGEEIGLRSKMKED